MKLKHVLLAGAFALSGSTPVLSQGCGECTNLAPTGDMSQITTSGSGGLNAMNIDWHSSHGSPSYNPGSIWMWSGNGGGEGVYYDGMSFQAGHTYCVTIIVTLETRDNVPPTPGSTLDVIATNSAPTAEIPSGGQTVPAIPVPSQTLATQAWPGMPVSMILSYTFTASSTWNQIWIYPRTGAGVFPVVEVTLHDLRVCEIVDPCSADVYIKTYHKEPGCDFSFMPMGIPPGLISTGYLWQFDDGTSSAEWMPNHYFAQPGLHTIKLTIMLVNEQGECCVKTTETQVFVQDCDPCAIVNEAKFSSFDYGGNKMGFNALIPHSPNFNVQWDFGDGTAGSGYSVEHTYPGPGYYTVSMTVYYFDAEQGICCHHTYILDVAVGQEGLAPAPAPVANQQEQQLKVDAFPEHLKEKELPQRQPITIFPNPSTGKFTVEAKDQIAKVEVFDLSGRQIRSVTAKGTSVIINLESEKPGSYQLKVTLSNGTTFDDKLIRK